MQSIKEILESRYFEQWLKTARRSYNPLSRKAHQGLKIKKHIEKIPKIKKAVQLL